MNSIGENSMKSIEMNEKSIPLLIKILEKCDNIKLLHIAKKHVFTLLKYGHQVSTMGSAAFLSKEEYQEFVIAKFYVDKCIDALKTNSTPVATEIEEGEIGTNSDSCDDVSDGNPKSAEPIPPLEVFYISPEERSKRLHNFWQNVKEGDLYHVQVLGITDHAYDLIIVNKHLNNERLIDLTINACMKKSSIEENLNISDLIRVAVLACTEVDSVFKLVVTADPAAVDVKTAVEVKLGKISAKEIPFSHIESRKFRSLAQYIAAHCTNQDPNILLNNIKALDIDPFKAYYFHPELDGKKGESMEIERKGFSKEESQSIELIKQAMICKDSGNISGAITCTDKALELNPKYDLAYALRASLYIKKANEAGFSHSLLSQGVNDYFNALKLNSHCSLARSGLSDVLLQSASKFLEYGSFDEARFNLECSKYMHCNKAAEALLEKLNVRLK